MASEDTPISPSVSGLKTSVLEALSRFSIVPVACPGPLFRIKREPPIFLPTTIEAGKITESGTRSVAGGGEIIIGRTNWLFNSPASPSKLDSFASTFTTRKKLPETLVGIEPNRVSKTD